MNTQFATNVHTFTSEVLDLLFEQFEGKTIGGEYEDSITKEDMMKSLFGDYKPGKVAKVKKGKKKKKTSSDSKKKKRLSGYTFFGAMNKEDINKEMKETEGEKPKYVSIVGKRWQALSDEGKGEWNLTAKSYNLFVDENEGSDVSKWKELSSSDKKSWNKKVKAIEDEKDEE